MLLKYTNNQIEYPLSISDVYAQNKDISFPSNITESVLNQLGYYTVQSVPQPTVTGKVVEEGLPVLIADTWTQTWTLRDPTDAESATQASVVRLKRASLLNQSDWTQTLDAPVDQQAWKVYRQNLRDITAQPGFPWTIAWPTLP